MNELATGLQTSKEISLKHLVACCIPKIYRQEQLSCELRINSRSTGSWVTLVLAHTINNETRNIQVTTDSTETGRRVRCVVAGNRDNGFFSLSRSAAVGQRSASGEGASGLTGFGTVTADSSAMPSFQSRPQSRAAERCSLRSGRGVRVVRREDEARTTKDVWSPSPSDGGAGGRPSSLHCDSRPASSQSGGLGPARWAVCSVIRRRYHAQSPAHESCGPAILQLPRDTRTVRWECWNGSRRPGSVTRCVPVEVAGTLSAVRTSKASLTVF